MSRSQGAIGRRTPPRDPAALLTLVRSDQRWRIGAFVAIVGVLAAIALLLSPPAVVAYDAGAVREVVGDAGLLVDPGSPTALGEALIAVLGDATLASRLRARAPARVAGFSWERAAAETLRVYRAVV